MMKSRLYYKIANILTISHSTIFASAIINNLNDALLLSKKYIKQSDENKKRFTKNILNVEYEALLMNTDLTIKAIKVGNAPSDTPFFQIRLNPISYTARVDVAPVFTQSYDFKSLEDTIITLYENNYS